MSYKIPREGGMLESRMIELSQKSFRNININ